jgi:hypothetical protein
VAVLDDHDDKRFVEAKKDLAFMRNCSIMAGWLGKSGKIFYLYK